MASPLLEAIQRELELLDEQYRTQFADKGRQSHDPSAIDELVRRAERALGRIESIPRPARGRDLDHLHHALSTRLGFFQREREAIARYGKMRPAERALGALGFSVRLVSMRFARHLSDRPAGRRDVARMAEMKAELEGLRRSTVELGERVGGASAAAQVSEIDRQIAALDDEIRAARAALTAGTIAERAALLSDLARSQFDLFELHVTNKRQLTRRPALLKRIIEALESIRDEMAALAGHREGDENGPLVEGRIVAYRAELEAIRAVRRTTPLAEIFSALEAAATELFEAHAASAPSGPRSKPDPASLERLCEELGEVQRQMVEIAGLVTTPIYRERIWVTSRRLMQLETDYAALTRAGAASPAPDGAGGTPG